MIDYCVINVRDDRLNNVANLCRIAGENRHYPAVCDYKSKKVRDEFIKKYPNFTKESYASEPFHNFNLERKNGEVGCWLSHISAWDYVLDHELESMLILEDDLKLNDDQFSRIFNEIQNTNLDLVMFGGWTACYYVTNAGAKIIRKNADEGFKHHPVDFYLFSCIDDRIVDGQIGPLIVDQDETLGTHLNFEVDNDS